MQRRTGPGASDLLNVNRVKRDAHGNVVELIGPGGSVAVTDDQRRAYTFDACGLNLTGIDVKLKNEAGQARVLHRELKTDPAFEVVTQASNWYLVNGSAPVTPPQQTRYRYDEHARLVAILDATDTDAAPARTFSYELGDPVSRILVQQRTSATQTVPELVTAQCYDGLGRQVQTRTRLSETRWQVDGLVQFDAHGAVVRSYQPFLASTGACEATVPATVAFVKHTYDALGRSLTVTEADGALSRTEYRPLATRYYDPEASTAAGTHANMPTVQLTDGLGRLAAVQRLTEALGTGTPASTWLEYDAHGFLTKVADARGNLHTQGFDLLGRLVRVADPNSGVTLYERDAAGLEVQRTDAQGAVVRSTWDTAGRLLSRWDDAAPTTTKVTWEYDSKLDGCADCTNGGGQLVAITWPGGGEKHGYDPRGQPVYDERTIKGYTFVTRSKFDGAGRLLSVTLPGALSVDNSWDGANRVSAIKGYLDEVAYDARGDLARVKYTNGAESSYGWDTNRELASLKAVGKDGQAFLDLVYLRNKEGKIVEITDGAARPGRVRHAAQYTLDAWSRVTTAKLMRDDGDPETLTYGYDSLDNTTSIVSSRGAASPAHVGTLAYGSTRPNAVTQAAGTSYDYDATGAMTARGGVTLGRDHLGRLVKATRDGATTGEYGWGEGFERLWKKEGDSSTLYVSDDLTLQDGISTVAISLGDRRVARAQSDALASFVLSDLAPATVSGTQATPAGDQTIDVADAWLAQAASTGALTLAGGPSPSPVKALLQSAARRLLMQDTVWLHTDHLDSIVAATNADGALVAERSFYGYGAVRGETGFVDDDGFVGAEVDEATGLVHFEYRDLDPVTGRWSAVDPAFLELEQDSTFALGSATSAYAYVANDFVNANDPSGLDDPKGGGGGGGGGAKTSESAKSGGATAKSDGKAKAGATSKWTKGVKSKVQASAKVKAGAQRAQKATAKKQTGRKGGSKLGAISKIIAKVTQTLLSLASAGMSIASAVMSTTGSASADLQTGQISYDAVSTTGQYLGIAAAGTSGAATLIGTGLDIADAFGSKGEKSKDKDEAAQAPDPSAKVSDKGSATAGQGNDSAKRKPPPVPSRVGRPPLSSAK